MRSNSSALHGRRVPGYNQDWPVRVQAHPLLNDQFGVFATSRVDRGETLFVQAAPLLTHVPAELRDSDRYIAWYKRDRYYSERFVVLDDNSHTSVGYHVNSAFRAAGAINQLDPHHLGPNVELFITVARGGCIAYVLFRATRPINRGDELLWNYPFRSRRGKTPRVLSAQ